MSTKMEIETVVALVKKMTDGFILNDCIIIFGSASDIVLGDSYETTLEKALGDLLPLSHKTNIIIHTISVPKNTLLRNI